MSLSVGIAWKESVALARRKARFVFPVAFLLLSLPPATLQLTAPVTLPGQLPAPGTWLLLVPIAIAANLVGALAISRLALGHAEDGRTAFTGLNGFLPLLGAALIIIFGGAAVAIAVAQIARALALPFISLLLLIFLLGLLLFVWARLILLTPAASSGGIGSFRLIRRAWAIGSGSSLKLIGVVLLAAIASMLALTAAGSVGVIAARLGPQPQPGLAALLLPILVASILQAVIAGLFTILLARLYAQGSAGR